MASPPGNEHPVAEDRSRRSALYGPAVRRASVTGATAATRRAGVTMPVHCPVRARICERQRRALQSSPPPAFIHDRELAPAAALGPWMTSLQAQGHLDDAPFLHSPPLAPLRELPGCSASEFWGPWGSGPLGHGPVTAVLSCALSDWSPVHVFPPRRAL